LQIAPGHVESGGVAVNVLEGVIDANVAPPWRSATTSSIS
jgi:hypothetical protein